MAVRAPLLRPLALALALAACGPGATGAAAPATRPEVLPPVDVRPLDGAPRLASAIEGRPALVSLWATWCEPCRDEIPALARLDGWARAHGAVVVAVAIGEAADKVTTFRKDTPMPYAVYVDEEHRFADALAERSVPATLVLDRTGRIVFRGGALDARAEEALKAAAER